MQLKRRNSWPTVDSPLDALNDCTLFIFCEHSLLKFFAFQKIYNRMQYLSHSKVSFS